MKYSAVTDTPDIILAKKNAQLVSNVSLLRRHHLYQPLTLLALCPVQNVNVSSTCLSAELQIQLWKDQTSVHAVKGPAPNPKRQSQRRFMQRRKSTRTLKMPGTIWAPSHRQSFFIVIWICLSRLNIRRSGRRTSRKPARSAWTTWVSERRKLPGTWPVM